MNKNSWYYENARTGEITDIKEAANWWADCGDDVNYWQWSNFSQKWEIAINVAGFALLIGLMIFATYNDLARLFNK